MRLYNKRPTVQEIKSQLLVCIGKDMGEAEKKMLQKEDKAKNVLKGKLIFVSLNSSPFPKMCPTLARKLQSPQLLCLGKSILKFRCSSNVTTMLIVQLNYIACRN